MEQHFQIEGMTCQNCRTGVMEKLNSLAEVTHVEVSLETGNTLLRVDKEVPLTRVSQVLGEKYTVSSGSRFNQEIQKTSESKRKELFPLFLIFGYLLAATFFLVDLTQATLNQGMLYFMGLFFITFSFFKFLDYQGFPSSFARYDPLAKRSLLYAKMYPFLETALGIAFLLSWQIPIVLILTLLILSITTYGVLQTLLKKSVVQCACLGTALKLPMTEATLIENGIMIVMSCILIIGYLF